MQALNTAISILGSQAALAAAIDVKQPTVSEWVRGERPIPARHCVRIERVTGGAVSCEELDPNAGWRRVKAKEWPWHPDGKPLVDVCPAEAEGQGA